MKKFQSSSGRLKIATSIPGGYRPLPDVDFDSAVTDALDSGGGKQYCDELSSGERKRPEGLPTFADIQIAYATKTSTSSQSVSSMDDGGRGHSLRPIAVSAGCVVMLFLIGLCWWMRSRS